MGQNSVRSLCRVETKAGGEPLSQPSRGGVAASDSVFRKETSWLTKQTCPSQV